MKNKRGLEMSINLIVIIVLSLLILIALILIINSQTGFFSNMIENLRGTSNVDNIVLACNNFAQSNQEYEFCCSKRELRLNKYEVLELTCSELAEKDFVSGRIRKIECVEC